MKYSYYTNLIFGFVHLLFQAAIDINAFSNNAYLFRLDALQTALELTIVSIFGIMGIMLLVSASRIKEKMRKEGQMDNFLRT